MHDGAVKVELPTQDILAEMATKLAQSQVMANDTCLCGQPRKFNFNIASGTFANATLTGFALCKDCLKLPVTEVLGMLAAHMV